MSQAPDLISAVTGYRQWRVRMNELGEPELRSGGVGDTRWELGTNKAECKLARLAEKGTYAPSLITAQSAERPHQAPGHDCACGIYGMHELAELDDPTLPSGAIAAWGRIEVHPGGFRAEFARALVIALPTEPASERAMQAVEAAAARYGVPCVEADQLRRVASELGRPVPAELRPQDRDRFEHEPLPAIGTTPQPAAMRPLHRSALGLGSTSRPPATTSLRHQWGDPKGQIGEPLPRRTETYEGGAIIAASVIGGIFVIAVAIAALIG
jgi:hypothetical protein